MPLIISFLFVSRLKNGALWHWHQCPTPQWKKTKKKTAYGFKTTWRQINNDWIFIFGWVTPFNDYFFDIKAILKCLTVSFVLVLMTFIILKLKMKNVSKCIGCDFKISACFSSSPMACSSLAFVCLAGRSGLRPCWYGLIFLPQYITFPCFDHGSLHSGWPLTQWGFLSNSQTNGPLDCIMVIFSAVTCFS